MAPGSHAFYCLWQEECVFEGIYELLPKQDVFQTRQFGLLRPRYQTPIPSNPFDVHGQLIHQSLEDSGLVEDSTPHPALDFYFC